jgi:adenosylmethionine-8-amino-7-oxononanoate aminotransferase
MDPVGSARYPFVAPAGSLSFAVARTEGAYLITPDGRRILDAAGGAVLVNIGHGRRDVAEAYARSEAG